MNKLEKVKSSAQEILKGSKHIKEGTQNMQWKKQEENLDVMVQKAVCDFLRTTDNDHVVTVPNKDKYHRGNDTTAKASKELKAVFSLMRALNLEGMSNKNLCKSESGDGGFSFAEALHHTVNDIILQLPNKRVNYVELGPEPVKTVEIISHLLRAGVQIDSYTAIDINPESSSTMHDVLSTLLPDNKVNFVIEDYHNLQSLRFGHSRQNAPVLVTMLGFQEGNEAPGKMANFYHRVTKPGDLLLSEMQVIPNGDWCPIFKFYGNNSMRLFSKIGFSRVFGSNLESEYGVILVPLEINYGGRVFVAVTIERFADIRNLKKKFFISNYCLKYSKENFKRIRELDGAFEVTNQRWTGDGSVNFQVAKRLMVE